MADSKKPTTIKKTEKKTEEKQKCGLVMPISEMPGYSEQHWVDVRSILIEALREIGYESELVSQSDDVGVIHERIIHNIYDNPIIVCDVSGKNPNVMFELGMRLAFDKPVVIINDDNTGYSFDTGPIEHIGYPKDLRFNKIVDFKKILQDKVKATHEASKKPGHSTFLKNFGKYIVAKLDTKEVDKEDFILTELSGIKKAIANISQFSSRPHIPLDKARISFHPPMLNSEQKKARMKLNMLAENDRRSYQYIMRLANECKALAILDGDSLFSVSENSLTEEFSNLPKSDKDSLIELNIIDKSGVLTASGFDLVRYAAEYIV